MKSKDNYNANMVLMVELGRLLVEKRDDFIHVLRFAGIHVPDEKYTPVTDIDLVNLFIQNSTNRTLLLGASFLISHNNKFSAVDGTEYTSPICADAMNMAMTSYFCSKTHKTGYDGDKMSSFEGDPDFLGYSRADGDAGQTAKTIQSGLGAVTSIFDTIGKTSGNTPFAAINQQQQAKSALLQGVLDAKKQQLANAGKQADIDAAAEKSKRTKMIIIGSIAGGLLLIGGIIVAVKVMRKK